MNVNCKIKTLRLNSNLTLLQVSSYLQIKYKDYINYEKNAVEIPLKDLEKLANLYGCDLYNLLNDDDSISGFGYNMKKIPIQDLNRIAEFNEIIINYLKMCKLTK